MTGFRAGAASLPLEPPLGLPMMGFIRQKHGATGYGLPLEVGAIALERDGTRVLLCGVDIVGIIEPEIGRADRARRGCDGRRTRGHPPQLEPHAPCPDGREAAGRDLRATRMPTARASIDAFARVIQDKIVTACSLAVERLEPAGGRVATGGDRRSR